MDTLESILTTFLESYFQELHFCMPAVVVGIKNEGELRVDVQPLPTRNYRDGARLLSAVIPSVPVIMPSTRTSALLLPVNQGDTVLLVFSQREIQTFKGGDGTEYESATDRFLNINDAVAIVGLNPFSKSPNSPALHKLPHNPKDLVLCHNLNTVNESEIRFTENGAIDITCSELNINGIPFTKHNHNYTDDGVPMVTQPPNKGA